MGHQNKEVDVESLQERDPKRGRCLDAFLVVSVSFLFVAMTALTFCGAVAVMDLRSEVRNLSSDVNTLSSSMSQPEKLGSPEDASSSGYKMQNFAYMQPTSSELKNSTIQWAWIAYGQGVSVGSNFFFDKDQHLLKPQKEGTYFMYIELSLSCTYKCSAGLLTVSVGDTLTCKVELPATTQPVSKKCWTVRQLDQSGLLTQMTVPKEELTYWKLDLNNSGFGIFLVD